MTKLFKYSACIAIVLCIKLNLTYCQDNNTQLFYDKSGGISQTYVLLTLKNSKGKITVIRTAGLSAYRISVNSDVIKTDTIIKGVQMMYKSLNDSIYVYSKEDNYYFETKDLKRVKLKQIDIKSDKLKQLRIMINNLDDLIGYKKE